MCFSNFLNICKLYRPHRMLAIQVQVSTIVQVAFVLYTYKLFNLLIGMKISSGKSFNGICTKLFLSSIHNLNSKYPYIQWLHVWYIIRCTIRNIRKLQGIKCSSRVQMLFEWNSPIILTKIPDAQRHSDRDMSARTSNPFSNPY